MTVRALFIFPSIFLIAAPDHFSVWIRAVPDLAAEGCAALAADQPVGENTLCAGAATAFAAALKFHLNQIINFSADDRRMAVFHEELRRFALVNLVRLAQKVHGNRLLQQRVALVFFVGQDGFDRAALPVRSTSRRGDVYKRQR